MTANIPRDIGVQPARKWIRSESWRLHEAFSAPSRFDDQLAEFRTRNHTDLKSLRSHTDHFCRAMDIYRKNIKNDLLPADFDIRSQHTWDEVLQAAKLAEQKCSDDAKGLRGVMRSFGRRMGDAAPNVNPWLQFIPNGDYTSVLCGGLKLAFEVAARMTEKRHQIMDTFRRIPRTIQMAEHCLENFDQDGPLFDIVTELYVAILIAIEGMMSWLVDKSAWRQIRSMLTDSRLAKPVDENFQSVQEQVDCLQQRVSFLRDQATVQTAASVERVRTNVDQLGIVASNIESRADVNEKSMQRLESKAGNMTDMIDGQRSVIREGAEKIENGINAQNGMLLFLSAQLQKSEWNRRRDKQEMKREIQQLNVEIQRARTPVGVFSQQRLAGLMAVHPKEVLEDRQFAFRQGWHQDAVSHTKGHWLMHSAQFQNWLGSGQSSTLLVDGNDVAAERTSAMSLMCALLLQSLTEMHSATAISFFCGSHTASNDFLQGPVGMVRSLISQLLCVQSFDLSVIDSSNYEQALQNYEIGHMCELLRSLVYQLPRDTVLFCVLDGIAWFETARYWEETAVAVQTLQQLTCDPRLGPIFKLLMTNPVRGTHVKQLVRPDDCLVIPPGAGTERFVTERQALNDTRRLIQNPRSGSNIEEDAYDEAYDEGDFDDGNLSVDENDEV